MHSIPQRNSPLLDQLPSAACAAHDGRRCDMRSCLCDRRNWLKKVARWRNPTVIYDAVSGTCNSRSSTAYSGFIAGAGPHPPFKVLLNGRRPGRRRMSCSQTAIVIRVSGSVRARGRDPRAHHAVGLTFISIQCAPRRMMFYVVMSIVRRMPL